MNSMVLEQPREQEQGTVWPGLVARPTIAAWKLPASDFSFLENGLSMKLLFFIYFFFIFIPWRKVPFVQSNINSIAFHWENWNDFLIFFLPRSV